MTGQQRALCRAADRLPYHRGASDRFDRLAQLRRSWGFWFIAAVAIGDTPDIRAIRQISHHKEG